MQIYTSIELHSSLLHPVPTPSHDNVWLSSMHWRNIFKAFAFCELKYKILALRWGLRGRGYGYLVAWAKATLFCITSFYEVSLPEEISKPLSTSAGGSHLLTEEYNIFCTSFKSSRALLWFLQKWYKSYFFSFEHFKLEFQNILEYAIKIWKNNYLQILILCYQLDQFNPKVGFELILDEK